ncbi:MAG: hypothetical protein ACD_51C00300G0002 [uncultured bacterium]|nr:MAG: hypothetical protein ACD_51C00300G0002 [uncultured bacterium]OGJ46979.1 MAG: hypothetical protein A2244_04530 [Candidatus Peregrinibacteria bacterium RIFOXYA2_FULL_41_18]OGJ49397.1 MAG: hypothetical protein A2344_03145 [Candidatus Peregrinibacteria bacterium RIFOXYB12_FULL_41_12]OGJ52990.1 MAG: hypothetical protein A2336_04085 [Candidatus Peregrinibacteria bacterium RIFOXYB2_FULL_41_88]OGJ53628.1 MAG: hypothetical protein A2448_01690 [Candidatus Peregrinibacteria bacterium RIFOXYC2_FULL
MAQQEKKQDTVLEHSQSEADSRLDKRIEEVFGGSVKGQPKGKFTMEKAKEAAEFSSEKITGKMQSEIDSAKTEKGAATQAYEDAKTEIRERHKNALGKLYDRIVSVLKLSGGENRKIDEQDEFLDTVRYAIPMINSINLAELVNTANGEKIYSGAHEENKELFVITEKVANKEALTEQDYKNIANRLVDIAGQSVNFAKMDDLRRSISLISQTTAVSVMVFLSPSQRFEVAKHLADDHGDKGAKIVSNLTKVNIFTVSQMEEFLKYGKGKISQKTYDELMKTVRDGTYGKAQEAMNKLDKTTMEDLTKWFHGTFASEEITYKNVLFWEVGRYVLLGTAFLNLIVNAKNKDVGGILFNVPMWASLGGVAYIYNDVTKGGLEKALAKKSEAEQRADTLNKKENDFRADFQRHPQLARWFMDNLSAVNNGFEKVNVKHDKQVVPMTFADMGVSNPGEKDGRKDALLETTISEWYATLYFDIGKVDPKTDQKKYLYDVINGKPEIA